MTQKVDMAPPYEPESHVPPEPTKGQEKVQWWDARPGEAHGLIHEMVRFLDQNQTEHQLSNLRALELYMNTWSGGLPVPIMASDKTPVTTGIASRPGERTVFNVIKSCVDTLVAKIGKNKIKPTYLTSGGSFLEQQKAKQMDKAASGVFYEEKLHEKAPLVLKNALLFRKGFLHIFEHNDKVCYDVVFPDEMKVDDLDAYNGAPRSLYRVKFVDRTLIAKTWAKDDPVLRQKILKDTPPANTGGLRTRADLILVIEAWHLGAGEGEKGRHTIAVENATLNVGDEDWDDPDFPFATLSCSEPSLGYWGTSLVDDLLPVQMCINRMVFQQNEAIRKGTAPKLVVFGDDVPEEHLTNGIMDILKLPISASATPPTVVVANPVSPVLPATINDYIEKAYQISGISQLSANSEKPAGLNSGRALLAYNDIETERFVILGQKYEAFHVEVSEKSDRIKRRIAKKKPDYSIKSHSKKDGVEHIKWKDVDLGEDATVIQIFPQSALPQMPGMRIQTVQEMVSGQLIPPEMAPELLDFPDVEAATSLLTAPQQSLKKILSNIIEKGDYQPPEPQDDPDLALRFGALFYLKARCDGVPEERLDMLRDFLVAAKELKVPPQQVDPATAAGALPPAIEAPPNMPAMPTTPGGLQ